MSDAIRARLLFNPDEVPHYATRLLDTVLRDLDDYHQAGLLTDEALEHVLTAPSHVTFRGLGQFAISVLADCPTCGRQQPYECKRHSEWSPPTTHGDRIDLRRRLLREALKWQAYRVTFTEPKAGKAEPARWTRLVDAPDSATAVQRAVAETGLRADQATAELLTSRSGR